MFFTNLSYRDAIRKFSCYFLVLFSFISTCKATGELEKIQSYLNGFDNVKANFEQWDVNGEYSNGLFYLQKPGKIRLDYNPPSKLVIVADGQTIYFADGKTGDISYTPISNTPASFFLNKQIDLRSDFKISEFYREGKKIIIVLKKKTDDDIGSLKLTFIDDSAFFLQQWVIIDPQGKKTIVKLNAIEIGAKLAPSLFNTQDLVK